MARRGAIGATGVARVPEETRAARRNKRRDWVRKGGLLDIAGLLLLAWFVLTAVAVVHVTDAMDAGANADWTAAIAWVLATLITGAGLVLWFRLGKPREITPDRYATVTAWAGERGWASTEPPEGEPFNRRVVAGQTGDSHRRIAYYAAHPNAAAPSVRIHGVSKHGSEDQQKKEKGKWRAAEIVHVVWAAPLDAPIDRVVVAAPADDPGSLLEPDDTTARRFESHTFNGAYRVLGSDPRLAHVLFDPALLDALVELRSRRVRLLWEADVAYVGCELELLDLQLLDRVPWLLERMRRNATLTA